MDTLPPSARASAEPLGPLVAKAIALAVSIGAHAAVALAVAIGEGGGHAVSLERRTEANRLVELTAPDVETVPAPSGHDARPRDPSLPQRKAVDHHHPALAAAPSIIEAKEPEVPRFVMAIRPTSHAGAEGAPDGKGTYDETAAPDGPIDETGVESKATLIAGHPPSYTTGALSAGVEADLPLEIVVNAKGLVVEARALAHVGYGLDQAALEAVRGYRFLPARRLGKPLAVRMRWMVRFQLR